MMIPKMLKAQMAIDAVTVKVREAENPFDAFLMICAGAWYFLNHKKYRWFVLPPVLLGGSGTVYAVIKQIAQFLQQ